MFRVTAGSSWGTLIVPAGAMAVVRVKIRARSSEVFFMCE